MSEPGHINIAFTFSGTQPRLNYDVLILIMSFSCRADISRLMKPSRILYLAGAKYLLHDKIKLYNWPVHILSSLCCFLAAEGGRRFRHLRSLGIPILSSVDSVGLNAVSTLFTRASCLETLSLRCAEDLLEPHLEL
ncbi:hypothetical protein BD413DRAFT_125825 [Trametes elegans]|nr:hypothetical protein BD413DRAFT_125825 [Trametes elegans]